MLNAVWLKPTASLRPLAAIHDIDPLTAMFHLTILGLAAGAHSATDQPHVRLRPVRDSLASPLARVSFSLTQSIPSSPLKASSLHGPQHHNRLSSLASISLALFLLPLVASIPSLVTPLASLPIRRPPPSPPQHSLPLLLLSSRQRYTHFLRLQYCFQQPRRIRKLKPR